jgi:hypothetical protein
MKPGRGPATRVPIPKVPVNADALGTQFSPALLAYGPDDVPALSQLLENERHAKAWVPATMALGFVGSRDASTTLVDLLERRFAGRVIEEDIFSALLRTPACIGLAAQKDDAAYDYLKKGTDPAIWENRIDWTCPQLTKPQVIFNMVEETIQAVGASGRPDAAAFIASLVKAKPREYLAPHRGAFVQAVFYLDWIQRHGLEDFRANLFTDAHRTRWQQWKLTERGREWQTWASALRQPHNQ